MITEIYADIEFFIEKNFQKKDDFQRLCQECGVFDDGLFANKSISERIKRFIAQMKSSDAKYITRLYTSLRALRPNQKDEIDTLFKLFTGFDSTLYHILIEKFGMDELRTLCKDMKIPRDTIAAINDIVDAAVAIVYYCKESGLPEKMILYLKKKLPGEELIAELERTTIEQTENLFLVSMPFADTASDFYKECQAVINKFFATPTANLYSSINDFSIHKPLDYCSVLRDSIDNYKAIIFIFGGPPKKSVTEEEIKNFENEYLCAYFTHKPIYVFYSETFKQMADSTPGLDVLPYMKKMRQLCLWHVNKNNGLAVSFTDPANLAGQLVQNVDQLIAKPVIIKNYTTPQVTPQILDRLIGRQRNKIFISYSRKDKLWLEEVKTQLQGLNYIIASENFVVQDINVFDDNTIPPGTRWENEIHCAMETAGIALLLISQNFLASKYIQEKELPFLLQAGERNEVLILLLILTDSLFQEHKGLARIQAINTDRPLEGSTPSEKNDIFRRLAAAIKKHMGIK